MINSVNSWGIILPGNLLFANFKYIIYRMQIGKISRKGGSAIWEIAQFAIISFLIVVPVRLWIAQPFIVRGASMEPTFHNGEYLIIDEFSYFLREPARGEVIVFRYPVNPSEFFIKRIIGLPGETIQIQNGEIFVYNNQYPDGFRLDDPYLKEMQTFFNEKISLNDKEYFVLGDNRSASLDSRRWGALDKNLIVGRTLIRLWPFNRLSLLPGKLQIASFSI